MTRAQMLAELKAKIRETTIDPAWGDSRLLAWMAEGQDEFCERTGYFTDKTSYSITLEAGVKDYDLPDRVIELYDIYYGTKRLGKFQDGDRPVGANDWNPSIDPVVSGLPTAWQTDDETDTITFDKTPTASEAGEVLTLRCHRYSALDLAATDAEPEIPSRFHWAPIEWACSQALLDHDMEKEEKVKADTHLANFKAYVVRGKRAFNRRHGKEVRVSTAPAYRT